MGVTLIPMAAMYNDVTAYFNGSTSSVEVSRLLGTGNRSSLNLSSRTVQEVSELHQLANLTC